MTKFQIFYKRVLFYAVVMMGCLTLAIDFDRSSGSGVCMWMGILICLGIASFMSLKDLSDKDINKVIGIDVF
jgi:hypothetical protein